MLKAAEPSRSAAQIARSERAGACKTMRTKHLDKSFRRLEKCECVDSFLSHRHICERLQHVMPPSQRTGSTETDQISYYAIARSQTTGYLADGIEIGRHGSEKAAAAKDQEECDDGKTRPVRSATATRSWASISFLPLSTHLRY